MLRGSAQVTDVVCDSRSAKAGACFVAVAGVAPDGGTGAPDRSEAKIRMDSGVSVAPIAGVAPCAPAPGVPIDGHQFIPAAVKAGCCAVICENPALVPGGVAMAVVKNTRQAAGLLAQSIRGWPARKLTTIGITGTNGKSTSTYLVRAVLEAAGYKPGLIGTIGYDTGKRSLEAANTTPGPVELAQITEEMVAAGKTHLVMEVSSHALDQERVAGLEFKVGVFTNLTGDHLDYHKTMERYLLAKQRLFEQLPQSGFAILNHDDVACGQLSRATKAGVITYGLKAGATLGAKIVGSDSDGTVMEMMWQGKSYRVCTPLIGRHNVCNSLCAAAACLGLGLGPQLVASALGNVTRVPGRLERVDVAAPYKVFVDYAHTDDALANVLQAMRKVTAGRLIVLFGCGGDRDRTKRPRMAKIAQELADAVVVTSDNPRTEEPQSIIDEILTGFGGDGAPKVTVEPDRRAAIGLAISMARKDDLVLLAGKGHENYQIIGKTKHHFDDVEVAKEAMARSMGVPPMSSTGILPVSTTGVPPVSPFCVPSAPSDVPAVDASDVIKRHGAHLPHWRQPGAIYAVAFRLGDSVPAQLVEAWKMERDEIGQRAREQGRNLSTIERTELHKLYSARVESYLDAGRGQCLLKSPAVAEMVQNALKHFDGDRYDLLAWAIMPNHVHAVFRPRRGHELSKILHSWKSFTAKEANKILGREGPLWQEEYYDHLIRDDEDLHNELNYVFNNPSKAGLVNWDWRGMKATPVYEENHGRDARATHGQDGHVTEEL